MHEIEIRLTDDKNQQHLRMLLYSGLPMDILKVAAASFVTNLAADESDKVEMEQEDDK